jgi:delta1-piperideine-2-carboxylate reductase
LKKFDSGIVHLTFDELVAKLRPVFRNNGCSDEVAGHLAGNCAAAERDAAHSHGLFRLRGYVSSLRSGWVDGNATPRVEDASPSMLRVDAMNGFTVPALAAAKGTAVAKAEKNGVAVIAIRNSHHLGALSLDVEPFAEMGFIALSVINSMKAVVPAGGTRPVFGTNPIAYAVPRSGRPPLVVDQATSSMAHGDIQIAAREGRAVPDGTGIDRNGLPTTDPKSILDGGSLLPFGGYKGAAISMLVEVLCAAFVGGNFSYEVDLSTVPGAATPRTGQFMLLIDPRVGRAEMPAFADRFENLIEAMREAGQERFPGQRRLSARERSLSKGIPVSAEQLKAIEELAGG